MNKLSNGNVRFLLMSAIQLAANNGAGFWSDMEGWVEYKLATKYTPDMLKDCAADQRDYPDMQWLILSAEINQENGRLIPYRVTLLENPNERVLKVFDCEAEDDASASAQAQNAYPECVLCTIEPFNRAELSYVAFSPSEDGYWQTDQGWADLRTATRYTADQTRQYTLPHTAADDVRWAAVEYLDFNTDFARKNSWLQNHAALLSSGKEVQVTPPVAIHQPSLQVSLDGGVSFQEAKEGVRVVYKDMPVPGEDEDGELHLNCTHEGIITDVWVTREEALDHNIGTESNMATDIVSRLVEENA